MTQRKGRESHAEAVARREAQHRDVRAARKAVADARGFAARVAAREDLMIAGAR